MFRRTLLGTAVAALFAASASAAEFSDTFFFGDSLSDAGTFAPFLPPGTGRFTTNPGPVWSEHLAAELGTDATPATRGGSNFAQGGARVTRLPGVPESNPLTAAALPIHGQIDAHLAFAGGADPDALYVVWAGGNDLLRAIDPSLPEAANPVGYLVATGGELVAEIGRLKAAGARHVVVVTVPDVGATPFGASAGAANAAGMTALTATFNQALFGGLATGGIEVIPLDIFTLLREAAADPATYGFASVTLPACGATPSLVCTTADLVAPGADRSFLFADGVHPTSAGHRVIADYALGVLSAPHAMSLLAESPIHTRAAFVAAVHDRTLIDAWTPPRGARLWAKAGGGELKFSSAAASPGASGNPVDFALGADLRLAPAWTVGAAFGASELDADFSGDRGSYDQEERALALYAAFRSGAAHATVVAAAGELDYDTKRVVPLGPARRATRASTDGTSLSLGVLAGYELGAGALRHGPVASLQWQRVRVEGFSERGTGSTTMAFRGQTREARIASVGYQAAYDIGRALPFVRVTLDHDFEDEDRTVRARLVTLPANEFGLPAFEAGRSYGTVTLGLAGRCAPSVTSHVGVTARVAQDDVQAYGLHAAVSLAF